MSGEPRHTKPPVDRVLSVESERLETWLCAFDRLLLDRGEAPADDSEVLAIYDLGYSPVGACEMVINARRGRG